MKPRARFEIRLTSLDTHAEVMRSMFKAVIEESEPAIWNCPWCHKENIRKNAGGDRCFVCDAIVFTEFTGYKNEIRVKHSQRPRHGEHLDCIAPVAGIGDPGTRGKINSPSGEALRVSTTTFQV